MTDGSSTYNLNMRLKSLESWRKEQDDVRSQRSLDGLEGRIGATDGAVDALKNQSWSFVNFARQQVATNQHQLKTNDILAKEMTSMRKAIERALTVPLGIVAFFVTKELLAPAWLTGLITVVVTLLALFFPEVAARLARKTPLGEAILPPAPIPPKAPPTQLTPVHGGKGARRDRDTATNEGPRSDE